MGLRYERTGSGAVLWVGETAVKASRAGRDCSLRAVERRLGAYRPAPAGLTVAVRLPEPDVPDAPCGSEYPAARGRYDGERCADTQAVRDRHRAEREALRTAHRSQRDALWQSAPPGGWHGRGAELNTQRSLLAARQAAEGAALRERHRRERARSRVQWGEDFPSYEDGLAAQTPGAVRRRARLIALIALEEETVARQPHDLRAFVAVVYARRVDYRRADDPDGPAGFVDRGREIAIYAEHDETAVRAALQLAAQKWGRFQVEGDAAYQALCVRLAAEHGFKLGHPELQAALQSARRAPARRRGLAAPP